MAGAINRRDFLKLGGLGAAAAALAGTRPTEHLRAGSAVSPAWIATWLPGPGQGFPARLFAAGGRIIAVEPNPAHPLAHWFDRAAAEALIAAPPAGRLLSGPAQADRPGAPLRPLSWAQAVAMLAGILARYRSSEIAIVLGEHCDHLSDLAQRLAAAHAGYAAGVLRVSPAALADGRAVLHDAAWQVFGMPRLPYFDLAQADLVFAFGVRGGEPWLPPPAGAPERQGRVAFDLGPAPGGQAEWIRIQPGGYPAVARALAMGVARMRQGASDTAVVAELAGAASACGLDAAGLAALCRRFANARRPAALPGAHALAGEDGAAAARLILGLNAAGDPGAAGCVFLPLDAPLHPDLETRPASPAELHALVERIRAGQVKALLVHGVDLAAALPDGWDVSGALEKLAHLVSFDPTYNETSALASLLLPGLLPLESAGYRRDLPGAGRPLAAALQPALVAGPQRRAPGDVLLAAAHAARLDLPYASESDFIYKTLRRLPWPHAASPERRWRFQGGWWTAKPVRLPAVFVKPA